MIRVTVKDEILYERSVGYADREKKLPFTKDSMFTLYSMSKPFCAMGLLLHHVSGLPEFLMLSDFKEKYAPGTPEKLREHLKLLSGYPQYFAPGTDSLYCNINFVIPALIIENVTGLSYEEYMQKAVFDPLGATLVVDRPGKQIPNRVQGYSLIDGQITPVEKTTTGCGVAEILWAGWKMCTA